MMDFDRAIGIWASQNHVPLGTAARQALLELVAKYDQRAQQNIARLREVIGCLVAREGGKIEINFSERQNIPAVGGMLWTSDPYRQKLTITFDTEGGNGNVQSDRVVVADPPGG